MTKPVAIENSGQLLAEMQAIKDGSTQKNKWIATKNGRVYVKNKPCKFVRFLLCLFTFGQYFKSIRADRVATALKNRCEANQSFMDDEIKQKVMDILQTLHGKTKKASYQATILNAQCAIDPDFVPSRPAYPLDSPESAIGFILACIAESEEDSDDDESEESIHPMQQYIITMYPKMLDLARALPNSNSEKEVCVNALNAMAEIVEALAEGNEPPEPSLGQKALGEAFKKTEFAQRFPMILTERDESAATVGDENENMMNILMPLAMKEVLAQAEALPTSNADRDLCIEVQKMMILIIEDKADESIKTPENQAKVARYIQTDFIQNHPLRNMFVELAN